LVGAALRGGPAAGTAGRARLPSSRIRNPSTRPWPTHFGAARENPAFSSGYAGFPNSAGSGLAKNTWSA